MPRSVLAPASGRGCRQGPRRKSLARRRAFRAPLRWLFRLLSPSAGEPLFRPPDSLIVAETDALAARTGGIPASVLRRGLAAAAERIARTRQKDRLAQMRAGCLPDSAAISPPQTRRSPA